MNEQYRPILEELREALTAFLLLPEGLNDDLAAPEYQRWIRAYDNAWWFSGEEPDRASMRAVIQDVQHQVWGHCLGGEKSVAVPHRSR